MIVRGGKRLAPRRRGTRLLPRLQRNGRGDGEGGELQEQQ